MIQNIPNEIFFKILDNLKINNLINLYNVSNIIKHKMKYYKIKLYFINNLLKKNNILIFNFYNFINIRDIIITRLEYICQNDFIFHDFHEKVFINYISGIDINGFSVFEYYIAQLKGNDFYILPECRIIKNKRGMNQIYLNNFDSQVKYNIYYEDEIKLTNIIKKYIIPNKNYKNILHNNPKINIISSYLI